MEYNKALNAKRNMIFGFINKTITLLCPFLVRTIIIWKLGIQYVGLNSLFTSVLQVLSLAELGVGSAIVYSMYKPIAENDKNLICALLNVYRRAYKTIGIIIFFLGVAVIPFLQLFISQDCPSNINIYVLYFIFFSNTLVSYFMYAYKQSLLLAHQRNDVDSNILTICNVAMYVFQMIALIVTENYYCYIIFLPLSTIALNLVRNWKVKKMYPEYVCKGEIPNKIKADMQKRIFGLMLTRICHVCRNSFDSIVISMFLGLAVLGQYQNYYYVMNTVIGFLSIVTTSMVAGIGNSMVVKTVEENYKEFKSFQFYYNWLATWCVVCLLCLYQPFMRIWVGKPNMMSFTLVFLMCLYFYSLKVGDVVAVYKEAAGIYWEDRKRPIVESIANLILNFVLVKYFGVYGVVISTIVTILIINIPWAANVLFSTYFKKKTSQYYKNIIVNALMMLIVSISTYLLCSLLAVDGWIELFVKLGICIVVPNIMFVLMNIRNPLIQEAILAFDRIKKRG